MQIKIEKVIPKGTMTDTAFNSRIQSYMKVQADAMKKAEPGKIKKYIDDNKIVGTTTASGLFYTITKPGVGDKPAVGDTAEVFYTAKYLNGKVFETNVKEVAQKNKTYQPYACSTNLFASRLVLKV